MLLRDCSLQDLEYYRDFCDDFTDLCGKAVHYILEHQPTNSTLKLELIDTYIFFTRELSEAIKDIIAKKTPDDITVFDHLTRNVTELTDAELLPDECPF